MKSKHLKIMIEEPRTVPKTNPHNTTGEPVANPQPPMDGKKPVPAGMDEVEKFLIATDSAGGD